MIINFFFTFDIYKTFLHDKGTICHELIKLFCNAKAKYVDICPHIYMYYWQLMGSTQYLHSDLQNNL